MTLTLGNAKQSTLPRKPYTRKLSYGLVQPELWEYQSYQASEPQIACTSLTLWTSSSTLTTTLDIQGTDRLLPIAGLAALTIVQATLQTTESLTLNGHSGYSME